jgi:signal peptidase I
VYESDRSFNSKALRFIGQLIRELLTTIMPAVLIALFVNVYVAEAAMVEEGPSMQPNLYIGYRVMTEKVSYRFHDPQRGDVVVVNRAEEGINLIKRVVGLAGEKIEVRGGHVWINGQPIEEPWVHYFGGRDYPATVIPEGHVFILGDNRMNSRDSRDIGPVAVEAIEGRAIFIYWPLEAMNVIP